jgi:hypothetical protein
MVGVELSCWTYVFLNKVFNAFRNHLHVVREWAEDKLAEKQTIVEIQLI